jgi:hypothetical protein
MLEAAICHKGDQCAQQGNGDAAGYRGKSAATTD